MVVAITAVAAGTRFWNLGGLGYSHWDEYFFISDATVVAQQWPHGIRSINWVDVPLVAYTDGTFFHFLGTSTWIPFAVSAAYGTLSAVSLYFLGSRLFGNVVGLVAAAILATAEFSIMYSRMALADATFNFWLIVALLFIWLSFTRRHISYYVLAGISSGLLLNTKYNGLFPLIFAVSWFAAEFLIDLISGRRGFLSRARSEYTLRVVGLTCIVLIAIGLFVPYLVVLARDPGLSVVIDHNRGFTGLFRTPPTFIFQFFWLFTSPPTILLSIAGIAFGVVRFSRADRFLLLYTAAMFVALTLYDPYPRLTLSLLPAVAIWAARATVEVWKLVATVRTRVPVPAVGVSVVCGGVVLIGQIVPLPHLLSIRTQGYEDAAVIAARYQATGGSLFTDTQDCAWLYLRSWNELRPTPTGVRLLNDKAPNLYFMTDQRALDPTVQAFFDLNRDRLQVIARVSNPLYPEVLMQPATEYELKHLDHPNDAFRYITIWKVTGPLIYPPSWPSPSVS